MNKLDNKEITLTKTKRGWTAKRGIVEHFGKTKIRAIENVKETERFMRISGDLPK